MGKPMSEYGNYDSPEKTAQLHSLIGMFIVQTLQEKGTAKQQSSKSGCTDVQAFLGVWYVQIPTCGFFPKKAKQAFFLLYFFLAQGNNQCSR